MHARITWSLAGWLAGGTFLMAQSLGANNTATVGNPNSNASNAAPMQVAPPGSLPTAANATGAPMIAAPASGAACANGCPQVFTEAATCGGGEPCGGRFYGYADYLLFCFRDGPSPALVQHVPTDRFPQNGQLNPDDAITIFGNGGIRQHAFNGFSVMTGMWLNECYAIEASYTEFESKNKKFFVSSQGDPSIGRFYDDVSNAGNPLTYLVYSNPNGSAYGYIDVNTPTRLWYTDVNVRGRGCSVFSDRCDWLVGFRYVDLRGGIFIHDFTAFNNEVQTSYEGEDRFYASNQFYGPQVGFNSWTDLGCKFSLDVTGKLAVGGVRQVASIYGATTLRENGQIVQSFPGNVLAQPTNIGEYERCRFAVVPELIVKVGYQLCSRVNVTVGYNIIAVSSVVRPGSIIDEHVNPNVNPFLIPGSNNTSGAPGFRWGGTDFWAQGLTLGFSVTY